MLTLSVGCVIRVNARFLPSLMGMRQGSNYRSDGDNYSPVFFHISHKKYINESAENSGRFVS